jgi:preprotein translocase subunit YajC
MSLKENLLPLPLIIDMVFRRVLPLALIVVMALGLTWYLGLAVEDAERTSKHQDALKSKALAGEHVYYRGMKVQITSIDGREVVISGAGSKVTVDASDIEMETAK